MKYFRYLLLLLVSLSTLKPVLASELDDRLQSLKKCSSYTEEVLPGAYMVIFDDSGKCSVASVLKSTCRKEPRTERAAVTAETELFGMRLKIEKVVSCGNYEVSILKFTRADESAAGVIVVKK